MASLTSQLVVRLLDEVTAPARKIGSALSKLDKDANGTTIGERLNGAIARNDAALDQMRGRLVDATAGFYLLKNAVAAPINAAARFETVLEDIGQKADIPQQRLATLGDKIRQVARSTNQATMDIAGAVDNLVGRGASEDVALAAAGPIGQAATAYRAAADDLAAASWAAVDNLKVPADQIGTAIDMMAMAGKEGAFELRDMAQYFPTLGAAYQGLGQSGVGAVADLAAALQVVRKGTGDASGAATNLANVLQKVYSNRTKKGFQELGLDIREEMAAAAEAGQTPIEAIAEITNRALGGDLSRLGEIFEDAQVQAGMRSLIQNFEEYRRIREAALSADGVVDQDFARRLETAQGSIDRWNASMQNLSVTLGATLVPALSDLIATVTPAIDKVANFAAQYPDVTANLAKAAAGVVAFKIATTGLKFIGLLGKGGALSLMSIGFNTVGRAARGARNAIAGQTGLQAALAGMSDAKYGGLQKTADAAKALVRATPGLNLVGPAVGAIAGALGAITLPGVLAIGAVAAAGALIYKYWDRLSSIFAGVGRAIGEQLAPAIEAVKPYVEWLSPIGETIAAGWSKAAQAISDFTGWLGALFTQEVLSEEEKARFENAGYDLVSRFANAIRSGAIALYEAGAALMSSLFDGIKSIGSSIMTWASNFGGRIGNAISSGARSIADSVSGWVGGGDASEPSAQTSGHRKRGGPVWPGGSFLVGEEGPEIFTPAKGGRITPSSKAGGPTINVTMNVSGQSDPLETARLAAREMRRELEALFRGAHADLPGRA